jgi:hypothetical protein
MARKVSALEALHPDVAVISGTLQPEQESTRVLRFASNASRLGIQVRSFGPYKIKRWKAADLPKQRVKW